MPATHSKIENRKSEIPAANFGLILALWLILLTGTPFVLAADAPAAKIPAVPAADAKPEVPIAIRDHVKLTKAQIQGIKDAAQKAYHGKISRIDVYRYRFDRSPRATATVYFEEEINGTIVIVRSTDVTLHGTEILEKDTHRRDGKITRLIVKDDLFEIPDSISVREKRIFYLKNTTLRLYLLGNANYEQVHALLKCIEDPLYEGREAKKNNEEKSAPDPMRPISDRLMPDAGIYPNYEYIKTQINLQYISTVEYDAKEDTFKIQMGDKVFWFTPDGKSFRFKSFGHCCFD